METTISYKELVLDIKQRIIRSRYIASRLANQEQLILYFQLGQMISVKTAEENWGITVIDQIANDLQHELPGLKGFSSRNLRNMRQFYDSYRTLPIGPSVTAQLQHSFYGISFTHHILILNKCEKEAERLFYISEAATQFWSVRQLEHHIHAQLFLHQGKMPNNFNKTLPEKIQAKALEVFKDQYLLDFVVLEEDEDEHLLEAGIVNNIRKFIMSMGKGYSFIGNQYKLVINTQDFYVDLLFFNRHLQCLVAIELKRKKFKPAYAGQLNFYLNVLDDMVKLPHENPSIGIVLCKEKDNMVVDYAIRSIDSAMSVGTYTHSKEVPKEMKDILPDADTLSKMLETEVGLKNNNI
ncbi:PDDEXK nuclease domain-containing protein [Chitinophaga sp. MM2321]|uniref:PDDEXK nuclease domain-containing protein n=1 Tax=Chitinophaga sp. MM2321 TaxID=3137178 RepID=UPI0032D5689C